MSGGVEGEAVVATAAGLVVGVVGVVAVMGLVLMVMVHSKEFTVRDVITG